MNETAREVIEFMDPEYREVLRRMLIREGLTEDASVKEVFDKFKDQNRKSLEEGIALLNFLGVGDKSKFAPKLLFYERCEALALYRAGITCEVLAKMYKVDRRTITHIYTATSPHYKNVRREETMLGKEKFRAKYLNDDLIFRAMSFRSADMNNSENNKYANGKAGLRMVQGKNCTYVHRVRISWIEAGSHNVEKSGWYYQDLDSDFPDGWFTAGGPDSLKTSMACYLAMLNDITDKLV